MSSRSSLPILSGETDAPPMCDLISTTIVEDDDENEDDHGSRGTLPFARLLLTGKIGPQREYESTGYDPATLIPKVTVLSPRRS
jgi:hypothetical protein